MTTKKEYDNFDIPDYSEPIEKIFDPVDPFYLCKKFVSYDDSKIKKENKVNL